MTTKRIFLSAICFLCLATPLGVRADIDPETLATLRSRFATADKNGDGKLTRDECQAGMPRIFKGFDRIDTDKRGYITLDQITAFVASR